MEAALPITETGYRSHFLTPQEVERAGGPVALVVAWLNEAARNKGWKEAEEKARQLNLF